MVPWSRISAGWIPAAAHQCRWDGVATPALDLSWFMDLQANCLSQEWEMPPPVVPLPCRGPLHPKISRKLAELSVPALSNCRGNISLLSTRLGTLLQQP